MLKVEISVDSTNISVAKKLLTCEAQPRFKFFKKKQRFKPCSFFTFLFSIIAPFQCSSMLLCHAQNCQVGVSLLRCLFLLSSFIL